MHSIKDFFKAIHSGLLYVIKNFPIIFIGLLGLFVFLILENHSYIKFDDYEMITKISFSVISVCLSSLFMTISDKSKGASWQGGTFGQLLSVIIGVGIYLIWNKFGNQSMVGYSIAIIIILLAIRVFLGYRKPSGQGSENNVWYYYSTLIGHLIVGLIYGITIMLGLFAIIKSVLYLFNLSSSGLWMGDIAYLAFVIIAPFVFLSYTKFEAESYDISKFVQFFAKYVLVSLLIVYAGVLLVYIGKISITQEWPKGILIYMIYGFAAIGLSTLYILYPLRDSNQNFIKWQRIYGGSLLLFLIVGIIAISIRVEEYGITATRYIVILLLIWFFYIGFCALFPRYFHIQKNLFVLWVLGFVGVFAWPVNMYNTVLQSQLGRREDILSSNNLLDKNYVIISGDNKNKISTGDIAKLSSIVDYVLSDYEPTKFAKYISGGIGDLINEEQTGYEYDEQQKLRYDIMYKIGLYYDPAYNIISDEHFDTDNYYNYYAGENWEININNKKIYSFTYNWDGGTIYNDPNYNPTTDILSIKIRDNTICNISLKQITQTILSGKNMTGISQTIDKYSGELLQVENDKCILRISNAHLQKISQDFYAIQYINGLASIK